MTGRISPGSRAASAALTARDVSIISRAGLRIDFRLPTEAIVSGPERALVALERRGYRVNRHHDPDAVRIGGYRITASRVSPAIPKALDVPAALRETWPQHLVQLIAPSRAEWARRIEDHGVTLAAPAGEHGILVVGSPAQADALKTLPFVLWVRRFAPAFRISPELVERSGRILIRVDVASADGRPAIRSAVLDAGGAVLGERPGYREGYHAIVAELDASALSAVAAVPDARWIELYASESSPDHDFSVQLIAGKIDPASEPMYLPVPGYPTTLKELGVTGKGTIVTIVDTGVDTNDNATMHPDLKGRMAFFVDLSEGQHPVDGWSQINNKGKLVEGGGHGTLVASIAVGNGASGTIDSEGFVLGLGVAPGASFGVLNKDAVASVAQSKSFGELAQLTVQNGSTVMNNSWKDLAKQGYSADVVETDRAVRSADPASESLRPLNVVFSAGNTGPGAMTIMHPHEGKNTIVVGGTDCWAGSSAHQTRNIARDSSRGPAQDKRLMPTVVAPGFAVAGSRSTIDWDPTTPGTQLTGLDLFDSFVDEGVYTLHVADQGTSFSAPHVSGACALLIEWWRQRTGRDPSPAMLKALVVNGADDLGDAPQLLFLKGGDVTTDPALPNVFIGDNIGFTPLSAFALNTDFDAVPIKRFITPFEQVSSIAALGGSVPGRWFYDAALDRLFTNQSGITLVSPIPRSHIPDNDQGWGALNVANIILQDDKTPARGPRIFIDQRHAFTGPAQSHTIRVVPYDTKRPLRVTLVWTDPPAEPWADPTLVNDLNLEVTETSQGGQTVFRGNVFSKGFSIPDGAFDTRNPVECVYVESPKGTYDVRVIASAIKADARPPYGMNTPWQDFALVIENAQMTAAAPMNVVLVVDRSGSMIEFGYTDVVRTSARQFIDHVQADDGLGCVSFGDAGTVDYPQAPATSVQIVEGQTEWEAAKLAIDGLTFGENTNMAGGILAGMGLLKASAAPRAMVLLSDGYDNFGDNPKKPGEPWAKEAITTLPKGLAVHTCAMGPASDQEFLSTLAKTTGGVYYYMPAIDDLFEICGYIRGLVSGDGVIVNEMSSASHSRVAAFVDRSTTRVRFSVAWADPAMHFVGRDPVKAGEATVRLRDPGGRLLQPRASFVRRTVGKGYVGFDVDEPMPGGWHIEVETAPGTHLRYTACAHVATPLVLQLRAEPRGSRAGAAVTIVAKVFDDGEPLTHVSASARVVAPSASIPALLSTHAKRLKKIAPLVPASGDSWPADIGRLMALRRQDLAEGRGDLFRHVTTPLRLSSAGLGSFSAFPGASQNVIVTVRGTSRTGARFVRTQMLTVRGKR